MIKKGILTREEESIFALRSIYLKYGYLPFKMSKFEEYELYARNKEFLVSDRVITFNDTNGRLMALKPDVTLSIIKNGEDRPGVKQKVCYDERVYRVSNNTRRFKEIWQTGLECIGDIGMYDVFEVISLAAKSLSQVTDSFVLSLSHLGLLSAIIERVSDDISFAESAISAISQKNTDELTKLSEKYTVNTEYMNLIRLLLSSDYCCEQVSDILKKYPDLPGADDVCCLSELLSGLDCKDKIVFDFSVVGDTNYYSGFVFKGFLKGVCESVLSGGQYDGMMKKMNRKSKAIGFALYLDLLEQLPGDNDSNFVDVLILSDIDTDPNAVARVVEDYVSDGKSVSVQSKLPQDLVYENVIDLRLAEVKKC